MGVDGPPGVEGKRDDGVRYVVDVGPGSTGIRVVVRHRLPDGGATDILGVLLDWAGGVLRIERRDGSVVTVDEGAVIAAKRVPPAPERRR